MEHYCLLVCNCLLCPQSMEALEYEVKALHVALEQIQATLTSPELARQSLKEQLAQRQVTTSHGKNPSNTSNARFSGYVASSFTKLKRSLSLQRLLADMESFKQQVQAVQLCQSALQVPEEVMPNLAICRTALRLQQEASHLQHVAIQQCNILQVQLEHCCHVTVTAECHQAAGCCQKGTASSLRHSAPKKLNSNKFRNFFIKTIPCFYPGGSGAI